MRTGKIGGQLRKERTQRERERQKQPAEHFLVQRDKRHLGNWTDVCVYVCVCGHAHTTISEGMCTMLALLILNLEPSGKYTPFPRESHRSAAELILCGHSSVTWTFHSSLFFLFLLEGVQQVMQKKKEREVCVGEVAGI